jgi:hypothetical protein
MSLAEGERRQCHYRTLNIFLYFILWRVLNNENRITHSTEQTLSLEAVNRLADQEIATFLLNPNVHYHVQ